MDINTSRIHHQSGSSVLMAHNSLLEDSRIIYGKMREEKKSSGFIEKRHDRHNNNYSSPHSPGSERRSTEDE